MKTNLHTQEDIVAHYHKIIAQAQSELNRVKQRIATISTLRILLFLTGAAGVYHGGTSQWQLSLGIAMGCLVPFLLLMRYHNRLFARKAFLEKLVEINRQEIEAQELRFDSLPDGEEFVDPAHLYSYDLDIFGPRSLFQYLNRTCTPTGKRQLAAWLNAHLTDKEQIEQRQEAVRELAPALTYRQHFRVWGLLHKGAATDVEELRSWGAAPSYFRSRRWMRRLPLAVGATNGLCLLAVWAGLMSASVWGAIWMLFVTVAFVFTQRITKIQAFYGKKLQILATYNILLRLSEEQQWQAPYSAGSRSASPGRGNGPRMR